MFNWINVVNSVHNYKVIPGVRIKKSTPRHLDEGYNQ